MYWQTLSRPADTYFQLRVGENFMAKSFKTWDTPANGGWAGTSVKNYTSTSSARRLSSWSELDWATLGSNCDSAANIAIIDATQQMNDEYAEFLARKEREEVYKNPEGGAYEGNLSDKYPPWYITLEASQSIKQQATSDILEQFCDSNMLKFMGIQLLPMLITYIAQHRLTTMSGDDYDPTLAVASLRDENNYGLISGKALYKQIFTSPVGKGLYYFLMFDSRSKYLETQYKGPAKNFCALVPLVLYAYKLVKGIPYSHWAKEEIRGIVNPKLATAMLWDEEVHEKPPVDIILHARDIGLMTKSGPSAGKLRSPVYTFKLYGETPLSKLPEYIQVMYTQIWCAHPDNRTKYMILDPSNWDKMPDPIIASEVSVTKSPLSFKPNSDAAAAW